MLINDILDLSKIESGTVVVDVGELRLDDLQRLRRAHVPPRGRGQERRLRRSSSTRACRKSMLTDAKRLQQIIKNLLSNAFKFTHQGQRDARRSSRPTAGWSPDNDDAEPRRRRCIAFSVTDTGIGISPDKQQIIFEAFQQADGTHQPQVRRHRPGPGDQPRAVAAAGRRDPAGQRAGRGQHVHAVPAADLHAAARRAQARSAPATSRGADRGRAPTPSDAGAAGARPSTPRRRRRRRRRSRPLLRQRGRRRPRRHPARRPRAADRRERPRASPRFCSTRRASRASRASSPRTGAAALDAGARVPARRRSRSTSTCPTSTAGACSTG